MLADTIQMFSMYISRIISEKLRGMHFMCLLHFVLLSTSEKSKRESWILDMDTMPVLLFIPSISECIFSSQADMIITL